MSAADVLTPRRRRILELLYDGRYQADIARELGVTKQTVGYHVGKLVEAGLVRENPRDTEFYRRTLGSGSSLKLYGLTEAGLEALHGDREAGQTRLTTPSPGGDPPVRNAPTIQPREPRVEVHNFEVKVPVEEMGIAWLPSEAEMQNWTRRWDPNFHGVYLEVTTQHILLRAAAEGATREVAEALCLRRVMRVLELLERHYGCTLGRPSFRAVYDTGRTKVGVVGHPLAEGRGYQEGEKATIDSTPEPGTIHPEDPRDADRIVDIARNAEASRELLEGLTDQQTRFYANLNQLFNKATQPPEPRGRPGPDESPEVA